MQRYNDVPEHLRPEVPDQHKVAQSLWPCLVAMALTLVSLACAFMGTDSRPIADIAITRLPTVTRTPLPTLTPTAISSPLAEVVAVPTSSAPAPVAVTDPAEVPPPTSAPVSSDGSTSTSTGNQGGSGSLLTALVGLNVRVGPGIDYTVVGKLTQGQSAEIIGKNPEGTWWQIAYPPGSGSPGWVSADAQYSTISNTEAVQIAQLPPPPPPTNTPVIAPPVQPIQSLIPTGAPAAQLPQTPIPTGNPTVGPTATPISGSPGWAFASVRTSPNQDDGYLLLYGDIINNTGAPQELAYVSGTFYDGQGQVIAGEDNTFDYWPIENVPPGGRVPFELTVEGIQSAANFNLSVNAEPSSETPRQDFEFSDVNQQNEEDAYCLQGRLRNPAGGLQDYLFIVAVLYDGQDNIINFSDYTELAPTEVVGDQTLDFEICVDLLNQQVARYELRAWGL